MKHNLGLETVEMMAEEDGGTESAERKVRDAR